MSDPEIKKAFMCLMIFLLDLLSYGPLKATIHEYATNVTLTNPIVEFLDPWFGLFWIVLGVLFLALAFYYVTK